MTSPTQPTLTLVSHRLCPYVQRAAIVLAEKDAAFERRWVRSGAQPDWFTAISPLGKMPALLVDGQPIFESAGDLSDRLSFPVDQQTSAVFWGGPAFGWPPRH